MKKTIVELIILASLIYSASGAQHTIDKKRRAESNIEEIEESIYIPENKKYCYQNKFDIDVFLNDIDSKPSNIIKYDIHRFHTEDIFLDNCCIILSKLLNKQKYELCYILLDYCYKISPDFTANILKIVAYKENLINVLKIACYNLNIEIFTMLLEKCENLDNNKLYEFLDLIYDIISDQSLNINNKDNLHHINSFIDILLSKDPDIIKKSKLYCIKYENNIEINPINIYCIILNLYIKPINKVLLNNFILKTDDFSSIITSIKLIHEIKSLPKYNLFRDIVLVDDIKYYAYLGHVIKSNGVYNQHSQNMLNSLLDLFDIHNLNSEQKKDINSIIDSSKKTSLRAQIKKLNFKPVLKAIKESFFAIMKTNTGNLIDKRLKRIHFRLNSEMLFDE